MPFHCGIKILLMPFYISICSLQSNFFIFI
nr:MAG TPA: hypothetical protein [Caudoviricetes sp.]